MSKLEKNIKVEAKLENLEQLVDFAITCAREWGVNEKNASVIHLAIDEACTNIIKYAYPRGPAGELELICQRLPDRFQVGIRDWGQPFDPIKSLDPDLSLDLNHRPIGGLGIFLMKKFVDKLTYRRENNTNFLTIVKKV